MSHDRNIKWLNDRRIVYRQDPITDIPSIETEQYKYYLMVRMNVITCLIARLR